jgi:hypothetical protein
LSPISSGASISVSLSVAGSDSLLVYDGSRNPNVRSVTISNLTPDMTYAFKVAPINPLGEGILSAPSLTVVATYGASASSTTL